MTKSHDIIREQDRRLGELMAILFEGFANVRQRFLDAGGDPRHPPSGLKGDDYMTDAERQKALTIARSLFNDEYIKSYLKNKRQNNLQPQIN
ncbi:MAG: hypothetical protein JGK24_17970 [Microcoleus sp. PH2017_29_MFU_D_A]|jgi:hypothetical protein|uniref:hypothetical protein n=1 Tax=unclassified Microcoleus TaxID=2642155 RepID=UPI001D9F6C1A|nr:MULTISPECIES: hypothetical protein [unclassified Microcoleus]MCC3432527.1 hypothetical protein [Microcoleus sp. PH2017_04_SCI_O_A]TAG07030.1 MAG: hypothetical protein EAZ45_03110 [Oscillatoriales cyanobacterium]MCC3434130.1 hypothetical protein [Microcoleus sp. PH2017_05_CCC_O_A]MCC3454978.1 hypothetical protein [Microcoleus sp. PH2017_08_TRC_O_A]MCC3571265.1 hypothetical protein [Microcoleus sp. PH2017_34_RAT_O_A]